MREGGAGEEDSKGNIEEALKAMLAAGWATGYRLDFEGGGRNVGSARIKLYGYWLRPPRVSGSGYVDPLTSGIIEEILELTYGRTWKARLAEYRPGREGEFGSEHRYEVTRS
ncbi:MAG: hypothetical protein LRS49_04990 [Desulfurococcales archaeon]|nr:hypothetical protein [Desulfurococcales archaeon]